MSGNQDNSNDDVPAWAKWVRRQLNGINLVIAGIVVLVAALATLWGHIPSFSPGPDCSDFSNLEPHQQEECEINDK